MKRFLYLIDLYSIQPQLYISNRKKQPSLIGSILSLFSIILLIAFGIYLFLKVLRKRSMTIIFNQENGNPNNLDYSNIPFIISIRDFKAKPIPNFEK